MNEEVVKIFQMLTIISLFSYGVYISTSLNDAKYKIVVALLEWKKGNSEPVKWYWRNKFYLSVIVLVALSLSIALILLSQFYDGILRIRVDFQIILSTFLWIVMIVKEKSGHSMLCRLRELLDKANIRIRILEKTIKDLENRIKKYEDSV